MADSPVSASPKSDEKYTDLKTPRLGAAQPQLHTSVGGSASDARQQTALIRSEKLRGLAHVAQAVVYAAILLYILAQLVVFTPWYNQHLKITLSAWWGVPASQANMHGGAPGMKMLGHSEMVRPTYVFLFAILPVVLSLFAVEWLRQFNVRRVTARWVLAVAMKLRRKPRFFGRCVSYFSYGELLFLFITLGGNVFVFYYYYSQRVTSAKQRAAQGGGGHGGPGGAAASKGLEFNDYLDMVAVTLGFNCIFNLAFLFLPATRNSPWMEFFNISYANAVKYHRWLGVVTVLTAFCHCVSFYTKWVREGTWRAQALPCFDCPLDSHEGNEVWFNVFGELALLTFLAIGLTSMPFIRRRWYELFYYTHQLFFVAVVFAVMHWAPIIWWILPTFAVYLVNRLLSSTSAFAPVDIKECTPIANDMVKIVIARSTHQEGDYKVGQFVYLNVPSISKLQWHAFTIASSPQTSASTLTILIKSLGGWTNDLVHYAEDCKRHNLLPTIYMDGFYGSSLAAYEEYSTVCLVAGGIGVTPLLAVLEDMVAKLSLSQPMRQKVVFVFTFRELSLLEEVHPLLLKIREFDPQEEFFTFHFTLTRTPEDATLDQPLEARTKINVVSTQYAFETLRTRRRPVVFSEPLRSRAGYRSLAYLTMFFFSLFLVVLLEYGNGKIKRGGRDQLWPLQQCVEALMLYGAAVVVVYLFFLLEVACRKPQPSSSGMTSKIEKEQLVDRADVPSVFSSVRSAQYASAVAPHVQTFRDLLDLYKVHVGQRVDVTAVMQMVLDCHSTTVRTQKAVGVFASGPDALLSALDQAVTAIGPAFFDIHQEEFEL